MPALSERCKAEGEKVREAGGLFICGTERHESRRIDNQLRGRSGRQGDPGASRFFLSAQDDLVRLFAGDRIYKILDRLGPVDEEGEEYPLEAKMLSKQIENAQKKVEEQNYLIRKRVLEYDDVMNEQRRVVYRYRREILEGRDMGDTAREQLGGVAAGKVDEYTAVRRLRGMGPRRAGEPARHDLAARRRALRARRADLQPRAGRRDAHRGRPRRLRRARGGVRRGADAHARAPHPLQIIDMRWKEHLHEMDYLREGIHLRGFAQIDPARRLQERGLHHVRGR